MAGGRGERELGAADRQVAVPVGDREVQHETAVGCVDDLIESKKQGWIPQDGRQLGCSASVGNGIFGRRG
jgi:hypothetical protein